MPRITPNLWFDTESEEAAEFYVSVFPNSKVTSVTRYGEGGPQFPFTEAVSLLVNCVDQKEIDHYWDTLSAGGEESVCGWLKDRYGLSWQINPQGWESILNDPDRAAPSAP